MLCGVPVITNCITVKLVIYICAICFKQCRSPSVMQLFLTQLNRMRMGDTMSNFTKWVGGTGIILGSFKFCRLVRDLETLTKFEPSRSVCAQNTAWKKGTIQCMSKRQRNSMCCRPWGSNMCILMPYQSVYWEVSIPARSSSYTIIFVWDVWGRKVQNRKLQTEEFERS